MDEDLMTFIVTILIMAVQSLLLIGIVTHYFDYLFWKIKSRFAKYKFEIPVADGNKYRKRKIVLKDQKIYDVLQQEIGEVLNDINCLIIKSTSEQRKQKKEVFAVYATYFSALYYDLSDWKKSYENGKNNETEEMIEALENNIPDIRKNLISIRNEIKKIDEKYEQYKIDVVKAKKSLKQPYRSSQLFSQIHSYEGFNEIPKLCEKYNKNRSL